MQNYNFHVHSGYFLSNLANTFDECAVRVNTNGTLSKYWARMQIILSATCDRDLLNFVGSETSSNFWN